MLSKCFNVCLKVKVMFPLSQFNIASFKSIESLISEKDETLLSSVKIHLIFLAYD